MTTRRSGLANLTERAAEFGGTMRARAPTGHRGMAAPGGTELAALAAVYPSLPSGLQ